MTYQTDALGLDTSAGTLPPDALNPGASSFTDVLLNGIAGAAVNALNVGTGASITAQQAVQVQQHNQFVFLVVVGLVLVAVLDKKL